MNDRFLHIMRGEKPIEDHTVSEMLVKLIDNIESEPIECKIQVSVQPSVLAALNIIKATTGGGKSLSEMVREYIIQGLKYGD